MAVYVDDMYRYPLGRYGRMKMSHMMADTTEELLEMADLIGVARRWLQYGGTWREHFDIALVKRTMAVHCGAREMTMREMAIYSREKRNALLAALGKQP